MVLRNGKLKKLANPFSASVALLGIIACRALLARAGFAHANVLYALIPAPVAILAHTGGMLLVVGAAVVTVLADTFATSFATGESLVSCASVTIGPLEKLLLICSGGAAVRLISAHFSSAFTRASRRAEGYLKKLYLQRKENASALSDAESCVERVRQDVDMYSSLVLLLEEAAEKIYSHLNTEELIETFFLVLRKCLSAETGAMYFVDEHGKNYLLHASFGYTPGRPYDQPEVVATNDPLVEYVALSRRAIALYNGPGGKEAPPADPQVAAAARLSGLRVGMGAALLEQDKVTGIVTINSFRDGAQLDSTRDTALLSMLCNITSIAFTNARLFMRIRDMADRDPLTKLFNRRYFYDALGRELSKCRLQGGEACVLLCDIDHFKATNDTYGHQAGDAVLIDFADRCRKVVRDCDVLARYGGEEFIFLLPGLSPQEGLQAARRIRRAIAAQKFTFDGQDIEVTASCGVAAFPEHASDVSTLTKAADLALYDAKDRGRNTVVMAGGPDSETFTDSTQTQSTHDDCRQESEVENKELTG